MNKRKNNRMEIRCEPEWREDISRRAAGFNMTVSNYIRTAIALGNTVLDGTFQIEETMADAGLFGDLRELKSFNKEV